MNIVHTRLRSKTSFLLKSKKKMLKKTMWNVKYIFKNVEKKEIAEINFEFVDVCPSVSSWSCRKNKEKKDIVCFANIVIKKNKISTKNFVFFSHEFQCTQKRKGGQCTRIPYLSINYVKISSNSSFVITLCGFVKFTLGRWYNLAFMA